MIQKSGGAKQKRIKDGKSAWVTILISSKACKRSYLNFNIHQASQWRCSSSRTRMTWIWHTRGEYRPIWCLWHLISSSTAISTPQIALDMRCSKESQG
jgi:hypothetical protein